MKAKENFDAAMIRAERFITLYDLIHDTRHRSVIIDWTNMREEIDTHQQLFTHKYLSELLRAALVATVSGLDRYMHDTVVERSWSLLSQREEDIPTELKKIKIPVLETKRALDRLRSNAASRPGNLVKRAIQEVLHRGYTFQKPDDIQKAVQMLGIKNFWEKITREFGENHKKEDIINKLWEIVKRRNQIVHEADIVLKTRYRQISIREISYKKINDDMQWIKKLVCAIEEIKNS